MDLEKVSKSIQAPNMDAQNVTAILMSFISQIDRQSSKRNNYNASVIVDQEEIEATEELALNLTTILLRSFENNTAFLHTLTKNLNNEEQRWKEEANRRVSDVSSTVLITIYVRQNQQSIISFFSKKTIYYKLLEKCWVIKAEFDQRDIFINYSM